MGLRNEKTENETLVFFVRHGERIHILGNRKAGWEIPGSGLSRLGKKQARIIATKIDRLKKEIDMVYCSKMNRTIETANEIGKIIGKKPVELNGLCEIGSVFWGRNVFSMDFWEHFKRYILARKTFENLLNKHKGRTIVVVAHGGVIKSIIGKKLGLSFRHLERFDHAFNLDNCCTALVSFNGTNLKRVHYFNA